MVGPAAVAGPDRGRRDEDMALVDEASREGVGGELGAADRGGVQPRP